ncbi:P-loop containing nucleoside triphosphate hydrolase protein [Neocallimastix lanati (nom. inval.)]|jgi:Ras-related protein Rab-11A/Ras-related protein Rab-11B|nr:P-loop containing nucleoside triphosphate hydrolase protein [Neocallimastix sp. JGI-2020a]
MLPISKEVHTFTWVYGQPENVIITGNFDNWEKKIQMDKDPLTNIFISRILLPINQKIIYKFVVDGIWQNDPMLPEEIDMQGNKNNVLIIKPNNTNNSFKQINDFNKKDTDNIQLKMIPNTINTKKLNSKFQAKQELKHTKYDFIETRIENNINNNLFKVLLMGDKGTGKTCILSRFAYNEFSIKSKSKYGIDFGTKVVQLNNNKTAINTHIWDTSRYSRHIPLFYLKGTICVIVVYDITNEDSFDNSKFWIQDIKNKYERIRSKEDTISIMLIGNKVDQDHEREVSYETGKKLAEDEKILFEEISALGAINVENAFHNALEDLYQKVLAKKQKN